MVVRRETEEIETPFRLNTPGLNKRSNADNPRQLKKNFLNKISSKNFVAPFKNSRRRINSL
jgi:hypothetical protein